ncbi:hypothetical protein N7510_009673 [Penicillium lagena]|uniref:uncharacterized protein n=1 Tax=Penicillium lagena TaxID=94218 RepID=UPI002541FC64|nr:uncharacterized protein N7510_009673 [Penicillium lagena]KAJ5604519.1 hypothetical protein N7510_009673 [Penicillium lagena]
MMRGAFDRAADSLAVVRRSCDANDAVHITVVQPGETKPKTLSTFHPQFTYPIFGDEERIFGYKGLIIRLRFAAHDLRPHIHISYDDRFKAVGDTAAREDYLSNSWKSEAFINLPEYENAVQDDPSAKEFKPPGMLVHSYEVDDRKYEIWAGSLADPEKVTPPTPTASAYSIVGYATAYRYWLYQRDRSETPTVKSDPFPGPEAKISELPARLRIAQFLVLPPHHRSGHGTHLYTTIHATCLADPTIVELTVEDPNEQFDALRDTADYCLLRPEFLKQGVNINPDPYEAYSRKQRLKVVPTAALIPTKLLLDIRTSFKIESTQFAHILEMYLLSQIPSRHRLSGGANLARLLIKKHKIDDVNDRRYYWWRMLIKQRLFKKHRSLLSELDATDRVEKLDETVRNVEEGYEVTLQALEGRLPDVQDEPPVVASESRNGRVKRKLTISDDEDEENGTELAKRPKV